MIKTFTLNRIALGVAVFTLGQQVIFYLKERVHMGSEFTAACLIIGMILMIPPGFFTRRYSTNRTLTALLLSWMGIAFLNMYLHSQAGGAYLDLFRENSNYLFTLAFLFLLTYTPEEISPHFALMAVLITLAGNLLLFYSLLNNPNYIVGMRATIFYGDGESGGNPHVAARNGFAGFIAAVILLRKNNLFLKLLAFANAGLSLAAIVMAQTRMMLLCMGLVVLIFLFFNARPSNLKAFGKSLRQRNNIAFLIIAGTAMYLLVFQTPLYSLLENYALTFFNSFLRATSTASTVFTGPSAEEGDASASYRVTTIGFFREVLVGRPATLIFGAGYKPLYMDVPLLQAFHDCGIAGLVTFGGFLYVASKHCLRIFRNPPNELTLFMAYFFVPTLVGTFIGGLPYDTSYLFIFALVARFIRSAPVVVRAPVPHIQPGARLT